MKDWTILIYANGNNELEPEVYQRFIELINDSLNHSHNIIVQLGRANPKIVKLLRPDVLVDRDPSWHGVRRYKIENSQELLLEDIGDINLSDPSCLVDFLNWGINNYPASRTMVIISGHGAGFVGVMTDYTKSSPYMMDIFGLTSSLYNVKAKSKKTIDCLVLDACYMNMIELWNEISLIPNNPVKYLLVPSENIELKGLSYSNITKNIKSTISLQRSLKNTAKNINLGINNKNDLILVKLKKSYFRKIKSQINYISEFISTRNTDLRTTLNKWCLSKPIDPLIGILDLIELIYSKYPNAYKTRKHLIKIFSKIIVYPKISSIHLRLNQGPSLYLPLNYEQYSSLKNYYNSLSFSKDNSWLKVIGGEGNISQFGIEKKQYKELPPPMKIPITYVAASIIDQNPNITPKELMNIINNIGWQKC